MAKIPQYKDIQQSNLGASAPSWTSLLLVIVNSFFRLVFNALNRRLNFDDNFEIQEFTTKVTGGVPFQFPLTLSHPAKLVFITRAFPIDFTGAVTPQWQQLVFQGQQSIQILDITGLNANQQYDVTFLVL